MTLLADVQPVSVCEKLSKYATVPVDELENRSDFFEDLLRYAFGKFLDCYILIPFFFSNDLKLVWFMSYKPFFLW